MTARKALGIRIRALRRLKRMTQQELAEKLNLSASQLSNIERGVKEPKPELLEKMAARLNIPREEFFLVSEKARRHLLF
ncbi:MAG TPA: helix-turn-helix transcriptional regulator [Firmicutes bacterium]|jgi:transcriptional regulator with XRE-family HTH domain|nr:helix-turn-helix transcriptional regulator [Bacillota bacterium]